MYHRVPLSTFDHSPRSTEHLLHHVPPALFLPRNLLGPSHLLFAQDRLRAPRIDIARARALALALVPALPTATRAVTILALDPVLDLALDPVLDLIRLPEESTNTRMAIETFGRTKCA